MNEYNQYIIDEMKVIDSTFLHGDKLRNKTILITGANGLIASSIVDYIMWLNLTQMMKIKVVAMCRSKEKAELRFNKYMHDDNFIIVVQDMNKQLIVPKIKIDFVLHAASNAHPQAYTNDPVGTMKTNLLGTINLLDYCVQSEVGRFMFISSSEIYGENRTDAPIKEFHHGTVNTMDPRSCYSESKRAAETLTVSYLQQFGLETVVVRPGYIYGPFITNDNTRADAQFLRKAMIGEDIVMKSKGDQIRSYCYIADAVSSILTVLCQGKAGEAYNIANANSESSIKNFAAEIAKVSNVKLVFDIPTSTESQGFSKVKNSLLDTEKISSLGWQSYYNLESGVEQMMKVAMWSE